MPVRVGVERGTKGKRAVAFALDWPGWSRGGRSPEQAVETLASYRDRYLPVARRARLGRELEGSGPLEVVTDYVGSGSTDFWGISFSPSPLETEPMSEQELERGLRLLRACWAHFDETAASVSAELAKGPRGGGRDRDRIWRHVVRTESEMFAKRLGMRVPEESVLAPGALAPFREDYVALMRAYNEGEGKRMRTWNLPFLIRHTAFHAMDHAWEMEDKDLS